MTMASLPPPPPSHTNQYLMVLAATMGAVSMGTVLGYSSPIDGALKGSELTDCEGLNAEGLTQAQFSWFSSCINLSAIPGSFLTAFLMSKIGRRWTLMTSLLPFFLGWLLIGVAPNYWVFLLGRLCCGVAAGFMCLAVPTYVGEIASPEVRGKLGALFQMMIFVGMLFTYGLGALVCWRWLALLSFVPVLPFVAGMFFSVETPSYLLSNNLRGQARAALVRLRGSKYDVETELKELELSLAPSTTTSSSAWRLLLLPHNLRPLAVATLLLVFQQWSGVFAILYNLVAIFETAGSSLSPSLSSVVVAVVQVAVVAVASLLMDRAGRRALLAVSAAGMMLAQVSMGTYFYLKEQGGEEGVEGLGWLPLVSLITFVAAFSIGYGPVPFVVLGEIFRDEVRENAGSIVTTVNWFMCFLVTVTFDPLRDALRDSGVYWLFAGLCAANLVFTLTCVKETKGRTSAQIFALYGSPP